MRISDWSSDVCSSDLGTNRLGLDDWPISAERHLITAAVEETVPRAGAAHFFKPHAKRLATAMQAEGHIRQSGATACRQSVPRLRQAVGPPAAVGILGASCWHEPIEAMPYGGVDRPARVCGELRAGDAH